VLHEIVELMKLRNVGCSSHVYPAHFFSRLFPIEITVDDRVVEKVTVGPDRVFQVAVPSLQHCGMPSWTVHDATIGKVIDRAMFLVSYKDKPPA
jgi:hypothetical protein